MPSFKILSIVEDDLLWHRGTQTQATLQLGSLNAC